MLNHFLPFHTHTEEKQKQNNLHCGLCMKKPCRSEESKTQFDYVRNINA